MEHQEDSSDESRGHVFASSARVQNGRRQQEDEGGAPSTKRLSAQSRASFHPSRDLARLKAHGWQVEPTQTFEVSPH